MESVAHPYSGLTPDVVLNALDGVGLRCDGTLLALNSYENRVYQVGIEDAPPVVAKFYRPGRWSDAAILEEHAFVPNWPSARSRSWRRWRWPARTLHAGGGFRFAVFPRRGGRAPELDRPDTCNGWAASSAASTPSAQWRRFANARPWTSPASASVRAIICSNGLPAADLRPAWQSVVEQALAGVRHAAMRAPARSRRSACTATATPATCYGPTPGRTSSISTTAAWGPAVQDLWMLLSGERAEMARQLGDGAGVTRISANSIRRELHLVEALRTLRLLHYSAWLARRWDDPAFPAAFPWFNTQRYWQDRILELREQVALMDEPPLPA
jgi:Ser/Thr protein kinase RdoA (MazF antagonist)